jgi:hypothetical protein
MKATKVQGGDEHCLNKLFRPLSTATWQKANHSVFCWNRTMLAILIIALVCISFVIECLIFPSEEDF